MNRTIAQFADRSKATLLFFILMLFIGIKSYVNIPKESSPDIKIPIIKVQITHEGISPEDSQRLLIKPMEKHLKDVEGVKDITSYATDGNATIILEFDAGFDSDKALQDVRQKVDEGESDLPTDSKKPTVHEINLSLQPVLNVAITSSLPAKTMIRIARDLKDAIEEIPEVLEVNIGGDLEEVIEVEIDPYALERYGIPISLVRNVIASNNILAASGNLNKKSGEFALKTSGIIKTPSDMLNLPVKVNGDSVLRLRDFAVIKDTFKDENTIARVNGENGLVLEVSKRTGTNIIETVEKVREKVAKESAYWPAGISVLFSQDESERIEDMVSDLENNMIFAIILVTIVIILTVGVKSSILIGFAIPFSFYTGVMILYSSGLTLNIVVLFSLILSVGMIVDDAIVVSEYANRKMITGTSSSHAYIVAAQRMLWPVISSTIVKVIVFLPLLFWPGVIGQFMKFMPITVVTLLTISMLFALFIQPSMGPLLGSPSREDKALIESMEASESGELDKLTGMASKYASLLIKVLRRPWKFILGLTAFLFIVYFAFATFGPGKEFFPRVEPQNALITVESSGNLSLKVKDELTRQVEEKIAEVGDDIKIIYSKSGKFSSARFSPDTISVINIELADWQTRRKSREIFDEIRARTKDIPGARIQILELRMGPPSAKPIEINVTSRQMDKADIYTQKIMNYMKNRKGLKDVEDSQIENAFEWNINVDRVLAAKYGVSVADVSESLRMLTTGVKVSSYRPDYTDNEVDIVLRFAPQYRNISTLESMKLVNTNGSAVPLIDFTEREVNRKLGTLKQVEGRRVITVSANVKEGFLADNEVSALKAWLKDNPGDGANVEFKGDEEDQNETMEFLSNAFVLALIGMFMVMLIQFNNFYHTTIVMSAVFLSTVGVVLGLLLTYQPFGIVMSGIGIISLGGIVLNNNILFLDTYQRLTHDGIPYEKAIVMTGIQRLRPILLTAVTGVLGLLPMVLGLTFDFFDRSITYDAPSSQLWRQLSASIAGGLTFATILTLFFTPCLLKVGHRFDRYKQKEEKEEQISGVINEKV
jgi:multidrug efflux pump